MAFEYQIRHRNNAASVTLGSVVKGSLPFPLQIFGGFVWVRHLNLYGIEICLAHCELLRIKKKENKTLRTHQVFARAVSLEEFWVPWLLHSLV